MAKKIIYMFLLMLSVPLCATAGTVELPKTGQNLCYDAAGAVIPCAETGQDGETQFGAAWPTTRFTVHPNGTVTDNLTGLIWLKDAHCPDIQAPGGSDWTAANSSVSMLHSGQCALTDGSVTGDWRLPNVNELESLVDLSQSGPALTASQPFDNLQYGYWTSSTEAVYPNNGVGFEIFHGSLRGDVKSALKSVWAVKGTSTEVPRTGQNTCWSMDGTFTISCTGTGADGEKQAGVPWPIPRFSDNGNGTITDNLTDLIWLKKADCYGVTGTQAAALTASKLLANGACNLTDRSVPGDWRLPNRNEFRSLLNYGEGDGVGWLASQGFSNAQDGWYWSSDSVPATPVTGDKWVTKLEGGTWPSSWLSQLTPAQPVYFLPVRGQLTSSKLIPSITWSNPDPIISGTALSETQLNAFASIPGTFIYSPAAGYLPSVGTQLLSLIFTPTDTINYSTANAAVTLTVLPSPNYTINFIPGDNGTLIGNLSQAVILGGSTTPVTAVPNTGYHFAKWTSGNGFVSTKANPLTVTEVKESLDITANFEINLYTITYGTPIYGHINGMTVQVVKYGGSTTAVTAVPNSGYHFVNWTGTNGFVTTTVNPLPASRVTASQSVFANFAPDLNTLKFTASAGGTIKGTTPQYVLTGGNSTQVTAVPNTGYHFVNWIGDNGFVTTLLNPLTVILVKASQDITAQFAPNQNTLNFAASTGGTIKGTTPQYVFTGGNSTQVTAMPNPGYNFVNWTDANYRVISTSPTITLLDVVSSQRITAHFSR